VLARFKANVGNSCRIHWQACQQIETSGLSVSSQFFRNKEKIGRPEANVFEPAELSVGRAYKVQWKKEKPNLEELARLYWVNGLTQHQVAERVGVRRATVADAAKKFKKAQFPEP